MHSLNMLGNGSLHGVLNSATSLLDLLPEHFLDLLTLLISLSLLRVRSLRKPGGSQCRILSILLVRETQLLLLLLGR